MTMDSGCEVPSKQDIETIFNKLRAIPNNKTCFDCGARNPTWSSVTYGVFICLDCSSVHRNLGVHITFVRSTTLDINWTWLQLRAMQVGGNANAIRFFKHHGCNSNDAQQKYKSRAASLYKGKLATLAAETQSKYGTSIDITSNDTANEDGSNDEGDEDFFSQEFVAHHSASSTSISQGTFIKTDESEKGPNVCDFPLKGPRQPREMDIKSSIIAKKPIVKKSALGAKKGMGAQKIKSNFTEIEKKAENFDIERENLGKLSVKDVQPSTNGNDFATSKLSTRLVMQDIELQRKRNKEIAAATGDPSKADVVERLGISGYGRSGISHSVASGIKTISQEGVSRGSSSTAITKKRDDDWDILDEDISRTSDRFSNDNDDILSMKYTAKLSNDNDIFESWNTASTKKTNRTSFPVSMEPSNVDTLKKFGNTKAISSDQFFGGPEIDVEAHEKLQRFEGSKSLGSADLFGNATQQTSSSYSSQMPEMSDIKDSMRIGVTKVAGKISSLGSTVSSYLSDRY